MHMRTMMKHWVAPHGKVMIVALQMIKFGFELLKATVEVRGDKMRECEHWGRPKLFKCVYRNVKVIQIGYSFKQTPPKTNGHRMSSLRRMYRKYF